MKNINIKEELSSYNLLYQENNNSYFLDLELSNSNSSLNDQLDELNKQLNSIFNKTTNITTAFNQGNAQVVEQMNIFDNKMKDIIDNE